MMRLPNYKPGSEAAASDNTYNEYLDLPDGEEGFAVLQRRQYEELEEIWQGGGGGWYDERRYVDRLVAFDEVHDLGILIAYRNPPKSDDKFSDFFQDFRRHAEIASQKILMEAARRAKVGAQQIVVLDATERETIHALIEAIRGKLNELTLSEAKRDSLFNLLNLFAAEVDRNRTRTEAFFAFAIQAARAAREIKDELDFKPVQQTIDRVLDWIEKANRLKDTLPPWSERKKIEGPQKRLARPRDDDLDEEIPF